MAGRHLPAQRTHRYDRLIHELHFIAGSRLSDIYGYEPRRVTSIHHQCVDQLGKGLVLEARSPIDLVPEGIRHTGYPFVMGVQNTGTPNFRMNGFDPGDGVLDSGPLMMAFLKAAARRACGAWPMAWRACANAPARSAAADWSRVAPWASSS